jgi:hypothetical protein
LVVYCPKEKIMLANLKGEDSEAWKYYLHKGMIKDALNSKTINPVQKANVAGIYADDKFQTGRIMKAAQLYAQSSQRFETVCMKLLSVDKPECL